MPDASQNIGAVTHFENPAPNVDHDPHYITVSNFCDLSRVGSDDRGIPWVYKRSENDKLSPAERPEPD